MTSSKGQALRVLVTGGGTIAPIDDVRIVANRSSGGLAAGLVVGLLERGAEVWHLRTPTAERPFEREAQFDLNCTGTETEIARLRRLRDRWLALRPRSHSVDLEYGTVEEYATALRTLVFEHEFDMIVLTAAVSDFEPVARAGKIDSRAALEPLALRRTPKVIESVRGWAAGAYLVGFKLLSGVSAEQELIAAAVRAGQDNGADLTVANDFQAKLAGRHALILVDPEGRVERLGPGEDLAERLAGALVERFANRETVDRLE